MYYFPELPAWNTEASGLDCTEDEKWMQFVGVFDGKEVFEGDKISIFCEGKIYNKYENKEVVFIGGAFGFLWDYTLIMHFNKRKTDKRFQPLHNIDFEMLKLEVIGNIYENPELLIK
jgi:uncharacterized phage protein (TIGR01671 family)